MKKCNISWLGNFFLSKGQSIIDLTSLVWSGLFSLDNATLNAGQKLWQKIGIQLE